MADIDKRVATPGCRLASRLWPTVLVLLAFASQAASASMVLVSDTSLVSGTQSSVFSFEAPGPGTVTAELTNVAWPTSLTSLTLAATTSSQVMAQMSAINVQTESFKVAGGVDYFAHINAVAGGPLDLGLYSLSVTFTPQGAAVPLPASGPLLSVAILLALLLLCTTERRMPEPPPRGSRP